MQILLTKLLQCLHSSDSFEEKLTYFKEKIQETKDVLYIIANEKFELIDINYPRKINMSIPITNLSSEYLKRLYHDPSVYSYILQSGGTIWGYSFLFSRNEQIAEGFLAISYLYTFLLQSKSLNMNNKLSVDSLKTALSTLSYSELRALNGVLISIKGDEGLIVSSKIADEIGITRTSMINAIKKMESASVLNSRSLGMKGTYIRILNKFLRQELRKLDELYHF